MNWPVFCKHFGIVCKHQQIKISIDKPPPTRVYLVIHETALGIYLALSRIFNHTKSRLALSDGCIETAYAKTLYNFTGRTLAYPQSWMRNVCSSEEESRLVLSLTLATFSVDKKMQESAGVWLCTCSYHSFTGWMGNNNCYSCCWNGGPEYNQWGYTSCKKKSVNWRWQIGRFGILVHLKEKIIAVLENCFVTTIVYPSYANSKNVVHVKHFVGGYSKAFLKYQLPLHDLFHYSIHKIAY